MGDTFAGLLRHYRREAGLSQEALAETAAISKDAVSALERGTRRAPYRDTVELLARALQLDEANRSRLEEAAARGRAERLHSGHGSAPASNLPQMGTMLVGRDDAVDSLLARLDEHRVVTIVGSGGIGKTRVALDVGERSVQMHRTGAWFCDFGTLTRDAPIAGKIASAACVAADGSENAMEQVARRLRSREGLLIFDNCEHVLDEAAKAAASIAACCPRLKVLATSRERLALRSESVYRLGALDRTAAGELFRMRASSAGLSVAPAGNAAVDEICAAIDHIPLAIELAAARAPVLGLTELTVQLKDQLATLSGVARDAPSRQLTMHTTIEWSYDLLDEIERALFRRLAVFAGGWTLDALEAVVVAPLVESEALMPAFTSLVEKSLVTADLESDPVRYRLLEPIRAFALKRLRAAGELSIGVERHAHWMADFATKFAKSEEEFYAPEAVAAALRELDNARAALEWSLRPNGNVVLAAQILGAMRNCWFTLGLHGECRRWCERILERLNVEAHPAIAAPVFRAQISLIERADEQLNLILRALPVFERAEAWSALAAANSLLALRYADAGRFDEAQRSIERAEAIREERHLEVNADWITVLMHRGYLFRLKDQFEEAAAVLDEAVALSRKAKRPFLEIWGLVLSSEMAFALGDRDRAIAIATEALAQSQLQRYPSLQILARTNLAGFYLARADVEQARAQAREAISLAGDIDAHITVAPILHLAAAAALSGAQRQAARLKGYCDLRYAERKTMSDPSEMASYTTLTSALEAWISADEIAVLAGEGAQLSDNEAAKLAVSPT